MLGGCGNHFSKEPFSSKREENQTPAVRERALVSLALHMALLSTYPWVLEEAQEFIGEVVHVPPESQDVGIRVIDSGRVFGRDVVF